LCWKSARFLPHSLMRAGQQMDRLPTAMAALLATRDAPLGALEVALGHAEDAGVLDGLPVGQRRERLQAEIDAGLPARERQGLAGHLGARERDIPAVRFPADRDRFGGPLDGTRPAHRDAPDRGEHQEAVVESGTVAKCLVGEAVETNMPLETRETCLLAALHPAEERLVGPLEPREHVLQDVAVDGGVIRERGPDVLQLGFLLVARERDVAALPGGDALLEGDGVELPAHHDHALQLVLLCGCRLELVRERLAACGLVAHT
jgi:hypothetical protein